MLPDQTINEIDLPSYLVQTHTQDQIWKRFHLLLFFFQKSNPGCCWFEKNRSAMWITAYLLDRLNVMLTSNKWLVSPNSLFGNCCKILFSYYACLFYPFLFSSPYCVHWNNLKKQSRGYADNYVKEQFIRFLVSLIGCMFTKFQFSIVRGSKINQ